MTETNAPSPGASTVRKEGTHRLPAALLPWLGLVGFLALGGGIAYVGLRPPRAALPPPPDLAPITSQVAALASELTQIKAGLGGTNHKIVALEQKIADLPRPPPPLDLGPIEKRLDALQQRLAGVARAESGLATAAAGETPGGVSAATVEAALKPLDARLAALEKVQAGLAKSEDAQQTSQVAVEKSVAGLAQSGARLAERIAEIAHLARTTAVAEALKEGRALGKVPGAPPALARYALSPPPTLSSLRTTFEAAAQAELTTSQSESGNRGFVGQLRAHLGDLITVRRGDKVLIGNPAAGVIAKARAALAVGDIAGALAALGTLSSPPAPALAEWMTSAKDLLAAEAALASWRGEG